MEGGDGGHNDDEIRRGEDVNDVDDVGDGENNDDEIRGEEVEPRRLPDRPPELLLTKRHQCNSAMREPARLFNQTFRHPSVLNCRTQTDVIWL